MNIDKTRTVYYKFLGEDRHSPYQDWQWPPVGEWTPRIDGELLACERGYHILTVEQLPRWISGPELWAVEAEEVVAGKDKMLARRCRLVRQIKTWNERTARLLAADFAEHVLHHYEARYPDDDRPRAAIEAARKFARGEIGRVAANAATAAAEAAADAAAYRVARAAAYAVADAAACATARDTVRAANAAGAAAVTAVSAANAAGREAVDAAADAAYAAHATDYADATAREAARAAAYAATIVADANERAWQAQRMHEVLRLEEQA